MVLKVASWNIFGGKDLPGVIECLKKIDADIIGLQEVLQDEDGSNNQAEAIAAALGYHVVYEPAITLDPSMSFLLKELGIEKRKGWGNAILSKYPILEKRVHVLSETRERIAVEAVIEVQGRELHVFSTHLVHGGETAAEVRSVQVESLLAAVSGKVAIVMGDFNATPESDAIRKMSQVMTNAESDLTRTTIGMHPERYRGPGGATDKQRLDYIFVSKEMKAIASETVDSDASDHLPVHATLSL